MQRSIAIIVSLLLTGCAGGGHSNTGGAASHEACPVGGTCQNLGGDVFAEEERLNQGLKADSEEDMKATASKIRDEDPEKLEETIEKLERQ